MTARKHIDKRGNVVKTGDACWYRGPEAWNEKDGLVLGVLRWEKHLLRYLILTESGNTYRPQFWFDGKDRACYDLEKIVKEEEWECALSPEDVAWINWSDTELGYVMEPELLAEEMEDGDAR